MASKRGLYKKANSESSSTIHNEKRCAIREYCMYLQVPAPDLRFSASAVGPANTSPKIDPSVDPSFSNLDLKLFTVFAFAVTLSNKSYLKTTRYEKKYFLTSLCTLFVKSRSAECVMWNFPFCWPSTEKKAKFSLYKSADISQMVTQFSFKTQIMNFI